MIGGHAIGVLSSIVLLVILIVIKLEAENVFEISPLPLFVYVL